VVDRNGLKRHQKKTSGGEEARPRGAAGSGLPFRRIPGRESELKAKRVYKLSGSRKDLPRKKFLKLVDRGGRDQIKTGRRR